jgi:hypothetical protein
MKQTRYDKEHTIIEYINMFCDLGKIEFGNLCFINDPYCFSSLNYDLIMDNSGLILLPFYDLNYFVELFKNNLMYAYGLKFINNKDFILKMFRNAYSSSNSDIKGRYNNLFQFIYSIGDTEDFNVLKGKKNNLLFYKNSDNVNYNLEKADLSGWTNHKIIGNDSECNLIFSEYVAAQFYFLFRLIEQNYYNIPKKEYEYEDEDEDEEEEEDEDDEEEKEKEKYIKLNRFQTIFENLPNELKMNISAKIGHFSKEIISTRIIKSALEFNIYTIKSIQNLYHRIK